jgi:hypothetical protein
MNLLNLLITATDDEVTTYMKNLPDSMSLNELLEIFNDKTLKTEFLKATLNRKSVPDCLIDIIILAINFLGRESKELIFALGYAKSSYAASALEALLTSPDNLVRAYSTFVLGEVGGIKAIEAIGNMVNDEDMYVASIACFSLGWNQGRKRFQKLKDLQNNSISRNRKFVELALQMYKI